MMKQLKKSKYSGETLGPKGTKGCVLFPRDLRIALRLILLVCFFRKNNVPRYYHRKSLEELIFRLLLH